jgi:hypothetical protein
MATFQPPPTYTSPMVEGPDGKAVFNSMWLDWFLSVAQFISATNSGAIPGTFTSLAVSGAVTGTGFTNLFASPSSIGGTVPAAGGFTTLGATSFSCSGASAIQALTATTVKASGAFGCNGAVMQTAYASGGAVVTTGAALSVYGYTSAAQANAIVTLLNNIRAALVANGIMS